MDADDGITIEKFTHQLPALFAQRADVVTSDVARCSLDSIGRALGSLRIDPPTRASENPADFYIAVQPAPHDPIFRREYLQNILNTPLFPPSRDYDSIAEAWFYYQLSVHPAKIIRVPGAWSIVGESTSDRLSHHWERQCAAALRLMQNFVTHCPKTEFGQDALRVMGRCAFSTWRALPQSFPPADRFLNLWQSCPPAELKDLGGRTFKRVAQILGPIVAGRIFKRFQRPHYSKARTIPEDQLSHLFA